MDIEKLINDLLYKMRERGIAAKVTYCVSPTGEIISFEVKIIGYLD